MKPEIEFLRTAVTQRHLHFLQTLHTTRISKSRCIFKSEAVASLKSRFWYNFSFRQTGSSP